MKRIELLAASFALAAVSCVPATAQAERQERSVQENLWRNLVLAPFGGPAPGTSWTRNEHKRFRSYCVCVC
jgi:hypothetical protein